MKLITERTEVRNRLKHLHEHGSHLSMDMSDKLLALDAETATYKDIRLIMGNDLWCKIPTCNECMAVVAVAVMVGEELDDNSFTASLCASCLKKALLLVESLDRKTA